MIALIISLCSGAIVYAVSVMYAGIGETFSERAGIMNLGVEGVMLMGAVSGYITAVHTQNLFLSFLVVLLTGAALGLAFAFLTVTLQSDQTVCGMAMLIFGTGLSGFIGKDVSGVAANLKFEKIAIPVLSKIPVLGDIFFKQNLLTYAMYFIIPLSMFYIYRTRYGLKLRALGENPAALDAAGENVFAMRYGYIIFGCMMMSISGACVSIAAVMLETRATGIYSSAPAEAFPTTAVSPTLLLFGMIIPCAPAHSAVRMIAPRLWGSDNSSQMTMSGGSPASCAFFKISSMLA